MSVPKCLIPFYRPNAPQTPSLRVFCFAHAGGSPQYLPWFREAARGIEFVGVLLSGHGSRFREPPFDTMEGMVNDLLRNLKGYFERSQDIPFVFLGHSWGALVAIEFAQALRRNRLILPIHLIVSGRDPPTVDNVWPISHLPDDEFLDVLAERYHGPRMTDPEILKIALPAMKADLHASEAYRWTTDRHPLGTLPTPITFIVGTEDENIFAGDDWANFTKGTFIQHKIPYGHFFYDKKEYKEIVLSALQADLELTHVC